MANFQNLTGARYIEDRGLTKGAEHPLMWQPLPIKFKGNITAKFSFSHNTDIPLDTFHSFQLDA